MTYDQIEAFISIVDQGSFQAASQALHKSQPSLSVAIKKLEQELELTLFDRSSYRPTLTPAGHQFYERCLKVRTSFGQLYTFAEEFNAKIEPEISLALDAAIPLHTLGPFLQKFFSHRTTKLNLSLEILEGSYHKVEFKQVDMAIAPIMNHDGPFKFHPLGRLEMIPVISSALHHFPSSEDLLDIPQIVVHNTGPRSANAYGLEQGKKWYVSDHYLKSYMIQNSLGWGRLPSHLVESALKEGTLISLESAGLRSLYFDYGLVSLKNGPLGPVGKELYRQMCGLNFD